MTFRRQLIIGHLISWLLVIGIAVAAVVALHVTSAHEGAIARELDEELARVQQLRYQAEQVVATSRGYLVTGESRYRSRFESVTADLEAHLRQLEAGPLDREGQNHAAEVERAARAYTDAATVAAQKRSNPADVGTLVPFFDETVTPRRDAMETSIASFADHERGVFDTALREAQSRAHDAQVVVVLAASLAILLGLTLARLTVRKLASQFEQMRAARHEAKAAANAREEMLAIVSHDLRNPLSRIVLTTALLAEAAVDDRARRHVDVLRRAGKRMAHMIDELLEAARIDAGTLVLHPAVCGTRRLVEDTLELFDVSAAERSICLRAECADAAIIGDRERIVEVLSNLVGNALKFTPRGGEVVVKAEPADHSVRFLVSDTGPGVAPDQLPHLFERYWQGNRSGRTGLGLGLYICKKLVEAHHGSIGIDSRLGSGSTFWFTLPTTGVNDPGSRPS